MTPPNPRNSELAKAAKAAIADMRAELKETA